jgi:(2Fe-2S) ferredoxin
MSLNIVYRGRVLYQNLTHEECAEILQDLSERYYEDQEFDVNELELRENTYG